MLLRVFLYILFLSVCTTTNAQFFVKHNDVEINYATANIKYAFLQTAIFNDSTLKSIQPSNWKNLTNTQIPISYVAYTTWLKIPISSINEYGVVDYVDINNPHINFLKCWLVRNDSIIKSFTLTGDNTKYNTRQIPTTSFVFALNNKDYRDCDIIIAADKRFTKLDLPIIFYTQDYFIQQGSQYTLYFGITIGFCVLLLLFNAYLFASLHKIFYVWYSLYLLLIVIYLCANSGLFFEYITPNYPSLNDALRPAIFCFIELPMLLFFIDLLDIKSKFPKLHLYNRIVILTYFFAFVIALLSLSSGGYERHGLLLKISTFVVLPFLFLALVQSLYFVYKKIPFAIFSLLSFSLFSLFLVIYSLHQKELIGTNFVTKYSNYLAIFSEAFLATFLLVWQYKYYRDQALLLQQQNVAIQQEIFRETAIWQEKEMQRISSLLHDTVGANLGFLRLETDNMPLTNEGRNTIAAHITRIGNEVRNMSHSFSPIVLQDKGLYNAIDDMVKLIRNNSLINIQFEWIGEKVKINIQYQIIIYRIIQELMQNMLKHSKANTAFLQIMIQDQLVSIYVEDDGIGMIASAESTGVGLKSIETLVQLLKGSCRIESNEKDGFSISIEFNQYENEKI